MAKNGDVEKRDAESDLGGTMRLGSYKCQIKRKYSCCRIYETDFINERHRHRYEANIAYQDKFEQAGLIFSGLSESNDFTRDNRVKEP